MSIWRRPTAAWRSSASSCASSSNGWPRARIRWVWPSTSRRRQWSLRRVVNGRRLNRSRTDDIPRHRHRLRNQTVDLDRGADRSRPRHADGRADAALLASGRPGLARDRHAARGPRAGRGPRAVPRQDRTARPRAGALLPPRHHALLRQGRGARHPLLLSRLAVRRRRPLPRAAVRARGRQAARSRPPALVSGAGALRPDLRLHGPAGEEAGAAALRMPRRAGARRVHRCRRHQHRQRRRRRRAVQLAAALRERARHLSRADPAREFQRHAVHRGHEPDAEGDVGLHRRAA